MERISRHTFSIHHVLLEWKLLAEATEEGCGACLAWDA
jgi:hypothetical protein